MKKLLSTLIVAIMIFSSVCANALNINKAYKEFKSLHPEFISSLTENGITEKLLLDFISDSYDYILEINQYTPVTKANIDKYAIEAINSISAREKYYTIQDTLIILYPEAVKLAITEGKVSKEFQPLVDTIKRLLFEGGDLSGENKSETDSGSNNGNSGDDDNDTKPVVKPSLFTDIDQSHWAYASVAYLAENFILNGYLDGSFKPESNITRAEFAKIIVSATNSLDPTSQSEFTDVSNDDWYYSYVSTAYKLGYIKGYPDGSFRPDSSITRADICTIVSRATGNDIIAPGHSEGFFTDNSSIPQYAQLPVYALASVGIINGYSDRSFAPLSFATRAQTAKIIYSAFFKK